MEKTKNREEYLKNFKKICNMVKLNQLFMQKLKEHEYFCDYMDSVEAFENEETKKVFILLELTKERKSCEAIVELLNDSNQKEAAKELQKYNTSQGQIDILNASTDIKIPMDTRKIPRGTSLNYPMSKKPRGKCIIINNEPNVYKESERFEHIFSELFFDVRLLYNQNVKKIKNKLETISKDKNLANDDAFIVMIISHGEDEKVLGIEACLHLNSEDKMQISDVVDIFSKENCPQLARKPKVFIFDCCREKAENPSEQLLDLVKEIQERKQASKETTDYQAEMESGVNKMKSAFPDTKWVNEHTNNFIIYSCSEGYWSWMIGGMTAFGQSLSHAIARYACDESLQSVMCRTCSLMEEFKKFKFASGTSAYSAPELRKQCAGRELFFNVGIYDRKKRNRLEGRRPKNE